MKKLHGIFRKVISLTVITAMTVAVASVGLISGSATMATVSSFNTVNSDTNLSLENLKFLDVKDTETPFTVLGLYDYANESQFKRLPSDLALSISASNDITAHTVYSHSLEPSGGRVRFSTTSSYISVKAFIPSISEWGGKMSKDGKFGFDLYVDEIVDGETQSTFYGTFSPPSGLTGTDVTYENYIEFPDASLRNVTIYFPLLTFLSDVYIGLEGDSQIGANTCPYADRAPIVWYGSSITQGGAVSKPGNTFAAIISRRFNTDFLNFGSWGTAKAPTAMANYLANIDMSVFVYDYDHNASNPTQLRNTHYPFYQVIRNAHPDLPIIMISRPNLSGGIDEVNARKAVIKESYDTARANGDANVYFIDGQTFFQGYTSSETLIDGVHPTDLGASLMAQKIGDVIASIYSGFSDGMQLFEDDFSAASDAYTTATTPDGGKQVVNGSSYYWLSQSENWQNYSVEAKVKLDSSSAHSLIGLVARANSSGAFEFMLQKVTDSSDKLRLRLFTRGGTYNDDPNTFVTDEIYDPDTEYTLKIAVNGAAIRCSIDGDVVFEINDTTSDLQSGYAGFKSIAASGNSTIDDFVVHAIGVGGDLEGISLSPTNVMLDVGDDLPSFTILADYGIFGKKAVSCTDPDVTVSGFDKDTVGVQNVTVSYGGQSATLTAYVMEDSAGAYFDDFSTMNSYWNVSGTASITEDGQMKLEGGTRVYLNYPGSSSWKNYVAEIDITPIAVTSGSGTWSSTSFSVRNASGTNGYEFGPLLRNASLTSNANNNFRLYTRGVSGAVTSNYYTGTRPAAGSTYRLRVEAFNDTITCYIKVGDKYVLTNTAPANEASAFSSGSIILYNSTESYSSLFDNLVVLPLGDVKTAATISAPDQYVKKGSELNFDINVTYENSAFLPNVVPSSDPEVTITGYDPNTVGRQTVTVSYGGKSTEFSVTVSEETIHGYENFNTMDDGTTLTTVSTGSAGWNVNNYGEVKDHKFVTNKSLEFLLWQKSISSGDISADFEVSNEQFGEFQNDVYESASGYGLTQFGLVKLNNVYKAIGFVIEIDKNCTATQALVLRYGKSSSACDKVKLAEVPFPEFSLDTSYNLQMKIYGNTVKCYRDGKLVIAKSFDNNDTELMEGCEYATEKLVYTDIISVSKRWGIAGNSRFSNLASGDIDKMTFSFDNFLEKGVPTLYTVASDTEGVIVKQNRGYIGDNICVDVAAPDGKTLVAGSLKYSTDTLNRNIINRAFDVTRGSANDGYRFTFNMPAENTTVSAEFSDDSASIATIGKSLRHKPNGDIDGIRFLSRLYLPSADGGGLLTTVNVGGETKQIAEIGALIIPETVLGDTVLDIDAVESKNALKVLAYPTGSLYDVSRSFVDFTVVMTGIENKLTRVYKLRPFVKFTDGSYLYGEVFTGSAV